MEFNQPLEGSLESGNMVGMVVEKKAVAKKTNNRLNI